MNMKAPLFLFYFQVTKAGINSRMRMISGLDWIKHLEVTCSCAPKVFPIILLQRKCCVQDSAFIFDQTFIKLAGNLDRHRTSIKFKLQPDLTRITRP